MRPSPPWMVCTRKISFLLVFFAAFAAKAAGKPGYLLTTHHSITPGNRHKVCISFTGVTSDVDVTYEFRRPNDSSYGNIYAGGRSLLSAVGGCQEFAIPVSLPPGSIELFVSGQSSSDDTYEFTGTAILKVITARPEFTLIQTDKPVYKPGQTVRIRLVTLKYDLSAVTAGYLNVTIKNPDGIDIERWEKVSRSQGIVELSLKLAEEPRLGIYAIVCSFGDKKEQKNFTVLQYVLPRVEIIHKPAQYLVRDMANLTGEVCARYTFSGGNDLPAIKGLLTLRFTVVRVEKDNRFTEIRNHSQSLQDEINGCYLYNVAAGSLNINWGAAALNSTKVLVSANVIEHGTGTQTNANDELINLESISMSLTIIGDDTYKPGLPYTFKVRLSNKNGKSNNEKNINVAVKTQGLPEIQLTETTNEDGDAFFTDIPLSTFEDLTIEARFTDETSNSMAYEEKQVTSWYSPSGRYLKLRKPNDGKPLTCNKEETFMFDYTTTDDGEAVELNIQVIGMSNIVEWKRQNTNFVAEVTATARAVQALAGSCEQNANTSITTRTARGSRSIRLRITPAMSPFSKLVIFYIASDGEVVADGIDFRVKECTRNSVKMSFSKSIVRPGKNISLDISAAAGSYCAYGVIDRSVDLVANAKPLELSDVFNTIQASLPYEDHWISKIADYTSYKIQCNYQRLARNITGKSAMDLTDSRYAFLIGKVVVLTDVQVDTRKCFCRINAVGLPGRTNDGPLHWVDAESEVNEDGVTYEPSVLIRDYFPETWLWDGVVISNTGRVVIPVQAPHAMTSWRGNAMCVHSSLGFGMSTVATLTTFQRFFMRVRLPYTVIREESVPVIVKLHNYYTDCFTVTVYIEDSSHFEIKDGTKSLCVCGSNPEIVVFRIVPKTLGSVNVKITARETNLVDDSDLCPPTAEISPITGIRDTIVKSLLVESEGRKEERVESAYVCARSGEPPRTLTTSFTLPQNAIPDSVRGAVSVAGDLLGITLANLQILTVLPGDCGEQSMVKFAPTVFVVRYLQATGQLTSLLERDAVTQLNSAYQKQLAFKKPDGSFSYYAISAPSLWLTAYMVKCFTHAARYLPVAGDNIRESIAYIRRYQLPNGCFSAADSGIYNYDVHRLAQGFTGTSTIRVTAFIIIAMLEAGVSAQDEMVVKGISCLEKPIEQDVYGLAMTAYAFSLHSLESPRRSQVMTKLWQNSKSNGSRLFGTTGNMKYWTADPLQDGKAPINIETTAYALLAILRDSRQTFEAVPVVNWLTQQQNSRGGYTSTQDTVITVQALAAFAEATYSTTETTGLTLNVSADGFGRSFRVSAENRLLLQSAEFSTLPTGVLTYHLSGKGCAVVQAKSVFNVRNEGRPNSYFETLVKPFIKEEAQLFDDCTQRLIQICSRYTGPQGEASTMTIIDVKMISGWTPSIDSLNALYVNTPLQLMRYNLDHQLLSLHFLQISREFKCLTFEITRIDNVRNAKPGQVSTYEYYSPAHRNDTSFTIPECIDNTNDDVDNNTIPQCTEDTTDECDYLVPVDFNSPLCPTCSQPRLLSKLCQYRHVLKVQLRPGSNTGEDFVIAYDIKTRQAYLRNRAASISMFKSCLCESLEDVDNSYYAIAYNTEIAVSRAMPTAINLSSKEIFIFKLIREDEEKIARTLRECPTRP